ncbi:helix-turn-helix domain-containing protein [Hydrogenimonas sp.]
MEEEIADPTFLERIKRAIDKKERNALTLEAYEAGNPQHKIAELLGISQPAVHGIIRRSRGV